jgi:RNA polymerase sigma factor
MFRVKPETKELRSKLKEIQSGNEDLRNQLITEYTDFVIDTLCKIAKESRENIEKADEFSIGLIAFDEALQKYSLDSKQTFMSFASLVIKRRLVDFWRKEQSLYEKDYNDEDMFDKADMDVSYSTYLIDQDKEQRQEEIQEEIREFSTVLKGFGMSFNDLVDDSPKHTDSKKRAIEIARLISQNDDFTFYLYEKKKLPIKALLDELDVSRKMLERNRKYIIAITVIFNENYTHLKEYLNV